MSIQTETTAHCSLQRFEEIWADLSDAVANAFRMNEDERERFKNKDVARLIGALPFLAGCDDAERTAVAHLGSYVLSIRETKPYANAKQEDNGSVTERLRLISNFKAGDSAILERGMALLALNMVIDYKRDVELDRAIGKYNPVAAGKIDADVQIASLKERISRINCPEMEKIYASDVSPQGYWSN